MTSPFLTTPVAYNGVALARDRRYNPTSRPFWLGKPGNMIQIPSPNIDYTAKPSQSEAVTVGSSGGTSVRRRGSMKWQWDFNFSRLINADLELILAFYGRYACGEGPWWFFPPEFVNLLTLAQSLCGNLNGVAEGWTPSAGTVAYDSTLTPSVLPSGVLRWTGATSGSRLVAVPSIAGGVPVPDMASSIPYLPAMPAIATVWASTATGTTTGRMRLNGIASNGTLGTTVNAATVTLTTTPQRLSVSMTPGALGSAAWVVPDLQCQSASAPNILISAPQFRIAATPGEWGAGRGVPRVVWPPSPDQTIDGLYGSNPSMTLAQI